MDTADDIWERHKRTIPGGVMSLNRAIDPMRVFVRAKGAYMWDHTGKRYIDYHAAFAPHLLGHNDDDVDRAVIKAVQGEESLMGAGTTPWEGELAELIAESVPGVEQVQLVNSGSEATYFALRVARAVTGRDQVLLMQGSFNGWHDHVAFNLMDPASAVADHEPGTEYPLRPITAGMPASVKGDVRVVEFNDLTAAEAVLAGERVAAVFLEPILQNIGVVKPQPGYLQGLRDLCDRYGTLLVFDEIKTGFRHAIGGYQSIAGVLPDLCTFGKAVANGYPMGILGGKREHMAVVSHPEPAKRVMIAGTYNAHPVSVAATMATLQKLLDREEEIYGTLERLGDRMEDGLTALFRRRNYAATVARQSSAFVVYFMDHAPESWRDIALNNDAGRDVAYRNALIEKGVFHFPITTKQGSISFAHSEDDIDRTLEITEEVLNALG